MNLSILIRRGGIALAGVLALAGAAAPVRAEGGTTTPLGVAEGLVVVSTDVPAGGQGTLKIHPAFGPDVTLKTDASTHFRKAGGKLDTPDELSDGALLPAVQKPTPAWFVGLFARAYFKANNVATDVALARPEPLVVNGVVAGSSQTSLDLNDPKRGSVHLTINGDTFLRKAGVPVADGTAFQAGDLAEALFWLTPTDNEALRVNGHAAPPQHFEGALIGLLRKDDGSLAGFDVTRGTVKMSFTDDQNTSVKVDGKPGSLGDLKVGQFVSVFYQTGGSGNLAVGVLATNPKPSPPTPKPNTGGTGDGDKGHNSTTGHSGDSGTPKPPTPRPVVVRPQVVEGYVSVACDGSVFKIRNAAGSELSFGVNSKTQFRKNDKPAGCGDLAVGQHVHVVFTPGDTKLALYVLLHNPPGDTVEHGSGGGAGTPVK